MARVEAAEDMFSKQSWFLNSSEFNRLCKYRRGFAFSCFLVIISVACSEASAVRLTICRQEATQVFVAQRESRKHRAASRTRPKLPL